MAQANFKSIFTAHHDNQIPATSTGTLHAEAIAYGLLINAIEHFHFSLLSLVLDIFRLFLLYEQTAIFPVRSKLSENPT